MTVLLPKQQRPEWLPPFLWSLLGGDDPQSQVMNLAQPLGFGALPIGMVRTVGKGTLHQATEYTGRDLLPKLLEAVGPTLRGRVEPIARTAIQRGGLRRYAETTAPSFDRVLDVLKREGSKSWRRAGPLPPIPENLGAGGMYSPEARAILVDRSAADELPHNALHELLHSAEQGAYHAGVPTDAERAQLLYDAYRSLGNPYVAVTDAAEAVADLPARRLLGLPYGTQREWGSIQPSVDSLFDSIIKRYGG